MALPRKQEAPKTHLGIEAELFLAADKLRGNLEPSEYKHVVLGLIFIKYISDAFEIVYESLEPADREDRDCYTEQQVFWVPKESRWSYLKANATQPTIGTLIDEAMIALEKANPELKGVLPNDYGRPALNKMMLGELIIAFSNSLPKQTDKSQDVLGRVYEYFLSQFAGAEGRRGGEFYTPRAVVRLLVEMLEPFNGKVYDPCCGSGGMFVQSDSFVKDHGGKTIKNLSIYGQESNHTTWKLCRMNLAVRGIYADIRWNNEGSFHKDELRDLRADYIMANPPFNVSDWGGEKLKDDVRWKFGIPPVGNANFGWLQHIYHHLSENGTAGVVLANGSMSSTQNNEGEIRKAMVEAGAIDCMIALPGQLFYSTQIPVCLWFLAKPAAKKDRKDKVLFIDARKLGHMVDRTRREFADADIAKIAQTYHAWRGEKKDGTYEDIAGFCKSVTLEEIRKHNHILTPGRYVGTAEVEDDGVPITEKLASLTATLEAQFAEGAKLEQQIRENLKRLQV